MSIENWAPVSWLGITDEYGNLPNRIEEPFKYISGRAFCQFTNAYALLLALTYTACYV